LIIHNHEYLDILRRKAMKKVVVEKIKEGKQKEKEEKRAKWVAKLGFTVNQIAWKCVEKRVKVQFITTWTPTAVAEVGDHFH